MSTSESQKLGSIHRRADKCVRVQTKAAQFTNHTKDSEWEKLAQCRAIARLCASFKAYSGEWAWKATCDRLRKPYYLSSLILDNDQLDTHLLYFTIRLL